MNHFLTPLTSSDPALADILKREALRQSDQIELIASENIVSQAMLDVIGSEITNKTVEGYPGKRFHGGAHVVDEAENLAIERAKELFGSQYANVQPHSGSQANQAVFVALLQPGDTVMSMALAAGGHLSHGAPPNMSGKWFNIVQYGVDPNTGLIDYDAMDKLADQHKPKLIIAGGSAYPREINFERLRAAADRAGATFLVDMAHIAGLVAGGMHANPVPIADIVTCTTTKTLRGPRGGVILTNDKALARKLRSAVFPGTQGSLHLNHIAAKAACFGEALRPEFQQYAQRIVENARALAETLQQRGFAVLTGGTDTHLMLVNVTSAKISGDQAEKMIEAANLTCNKNALPGDPIKPALWSGVRLGVSAATTRGMGIGEMRSIGTCLADIWCSANADGQPKPEAIAAAKQKIAAITQAFPIA